MKRKQVQSILEKLEKSILHVRDPASVAVITGLCNLVESLVEQTETQAEQIQALKDEINHLKGEQGKPNTRKQSKGKNEESEHSSEEERKKREPKKPRKPGGTKKSSVTVIP